MGLVQENIFGGYTEIKKKTVTKKKKQNTDLENKIAILYGMYYELYLRQDIDILEQRDVVQKGNILVYPEDKQAEPIELTEFTIYDIDKRIEKMKEILK